MTRDAPGIPLSTKRVRLRVVTPDDYEFLYELMTEPAVGTKLRFRGATPSPEEVIGSLWDHVLVQFLVEGAQTGEPLGLVVCSSPDYRNGFAYLSVMATPDKFGTGLLLEATALFVNHLFTNWDFRKLYAETLDPSFGSFKSGRDRWFHEEGLLRAHEFIDGHYADLHVLAVYREDAQRLRDSVLPRLTN